MNLPAKFAVVLLCAALCAIGFFPRAEKRAPQPTRTSVTPAQLRDKAKPNWLLV